MELTEKEKAIVLELVNGVQLGNIHPDILQDFIGLKIKLDDK